MTDKNTTEEQQARAAIDTVARNLITKAYHHALDFNAVDWSDYPEIGERDWRAVVKRGDELVEQQFDQGVDEFQRAYSLLEGRAGETA